MKNLIRKLNELANNFVQFNVKVIYSKNNKGLAKIYAIFLKALSFIFAGIVRLRHIFYNNRIFRDAQLGCLVVIVGNLTVGGTGKTPVVESFARALQNRGRKVAILSRGYKSKSETKWEKFIRFMTNTPEPPPKLVSDGKNILLDSEIAGDEPYMLAKNLAGVVVVVDKDRVKAGQFAIKNFGVDTLILDDGFQYLPLKGQLRLLLVDKTNPFGNMSMLPRGILREPIEHLKRASYIFLTKSDGTPDPALETIIRTHNPVAEIIECTHKPVNLFDLYTDKTFPLGTLKDANIAYFCAIAAPDSFEKFLVDYGANIKYKKHFLDHHRFDEYDLNKFFEKAKAHGADLVITTEKDAVRISQEYKATLPLLYTRIEIEILDGKDDFAAAVERICFLS